jgi:hypothetical protein
MADLTTTGLSRGVWLETPVLQQTSRQQTAQRAAARRPAQEQQQPRRTRQLQKAAGLRQGQQQLREQQQRQPQRMWSSLCRIAIGALQGSGCRSVQAVALLRSPFAALSEVLVVAPFRSRVQQVDSASAGYGAARVALQGQRVRQRAPQVLRCSGCDRRRTGGGRRSCSSREAAAEQLAWKVSWCSRGWCSCCGLWNS